MYGATQDPLLTDGVLKGDDRVIFQGIVATVVVPVLERLCDFERQK